MTTTPKKTEAQPAPAQVHQAIAAVMGEIGQLGIAKGGTNKEQGYAFRRIEDVLASFNKAMTTHGLVIVPKALERHVEHLPARSGQMTYVSIHVEYTLVGPDGSILTAAYWGEGADKGDKATSKAQTNAFKYLMITMFCVPLEGMLDGDDDTPDRNTVIQEHQADQLAEQRAREQARNRLLATGQRKGLDADGVIAWCIQQYNGHPKNASVADLITAEQELAKQPDKAQAGTGEQQRRPQGSDNHPAGRRKAQGKACTHPKGFTWADDGNGHQGSVCELCGTPEPEQQGEPKRPGIPGQRPRPGDDPEWGTRTGD